MSDSGEFTIAWTTEIRNEQEWLLSEPVAFRRFSDDGTPAGAEIVMHAPEDPAQWQYELAGSPQIAMAPNGSMVLAWAFGSAHAQRFDSTGATLGGEISISYYGPGAVWFVPRVRTVAVDNLDGGQFAISWMEGQQLAFSQQFDAAGAPMRDMELIPVANDAVIVSVEASYGADASLMVAAALADGFTAQEFDASADPTGWPFDIPLESPRVLNLSRTSAGGFVAVYQRVTGGIDARLFTPDSTAPTVSTAEYEFDTARSVQLHFSEDVTFTSSAWVRLERRENSGDWVSLEVPTTTGPTASASFAIPVTIGDGNYRLVITAGSAKDRAGIDLEPYEFDFFVFAGDANHDRNIDVADFKALTSNWMQTNRTFSQGDFNYDDAVNQADLDILSAKWNTTLPAYVEPVPTKAPAPTPSKRSRTITSLVLT